MRILLTGANGQLGQEFIYRAPKDWYIFAYDSTKLDISNFVVLETEIANIKPDVIVNAAAFTKVDFAEKDMDKANEVNALSVLYLAKLARKHNAKLVHFSSDYVFDGRKTTPYTEDDVTNPLNVYGQSKLAGENLALSYHVNTLIIRTSWSYGAFGSNFLKTMLRLATEKEQMNLVGDQYGTPTYTRDIVDALVTLLLTRPLLRGIINVSGDTVCSWADFAEFIFSKAIELRVISKVPMITRVNSTEYAAIARRPIYSALDNTLVCSMGIKMSSLESSIVNSLIDLNSLDSNIMDTKIPCK